MALRRMTAALVLMVLGWGLGAETILMGLREVPPYVMRKSDGGYGGLEYEIIAAALAVRGHSIRPVLMPLARLVDTFREGSVQAAAPMLLAHRSGGTLSDSYITYRNIALTLKSSRLELLTVHDLARPSIMAFQTASKVLGSEYANVVTRNPLYTEEAQQITQIRMLFSGRIQVVVGDSRILAYFSRAPETGIERKEEVREFALFKPTYYSVAFHGARLATDFNHGLKVIRDNGTLAAIMAMYQ